jgi:hypothetical protein
MDDYDKYIKELNELPKHEIKKNAGPRILSAEAINRQSKGDGQISEEVATILDTIQDDVKQAIEKKQTRCITELPTSFDIGGMSNERAQKYIYYHVIGNLEKSGYIPKIKFVGKKSETQRVFLTTNWLTESDLDLEKHMNKYIQDHTDSKETSERVVVQPIRVSGRRGKTGSTDN